MDYNHNNCCYIILSLLHLLLRSIQLLYEHFPRSRSDLCLFLKTNTRHHVILDNVYQGKNPVHCRSVGR